MAGRCLSRTSSAEPWEVGIDRPGTWADPATCACPAVYPFGTRFVLPGGEVFRCNDRGGKIVSLADGTFWLDLMVRVAPVPFGTVVPVRIFGPF